MIMTVRFNISNIFCLFRSTSAENSASGFIYLQGGKEFASYDKQFQRCRKSQKNKTKRAKGSREGGGGENVSILGDDVNGYLFSLVFSIFYRCLVIVT